MNISSLLLVLLALAVIGYAWGRKKSSATVQGHLSKLHSRLGYYGSYVALATFLPAVIVLMLWASVAPTIINNKLSGALPEELKQNTSDAERSLILNSIYSIATGLDLINEDEKNLINQDVANLQPILQQHGVVLASPGQTYMVDLATELNHWEKNTRNVQTVVVILIALAGLIASIATLKPSLRARNRVELVMLGALLLASMIAILTTVGIVLSMISETIHFFGMVPLHEFFFGTVWDPRFAAADNPDAVGQYGLIPLLAGTLYIALVAMLFAVPVGLYSAIYMAEYATPKVRSTVKPLLEVLAGIPTIVYGFFAMVTVGPFFRDLSSSLNNLATGEVMPFIQAQSVLTAGIVMGIMLIPFVSSLSDDIITAVPRSLRDGSLGLGATRSETMRKVILPAALPGVVGALLLTASRAIGETMIVVLAAGVAARLSLNPFEPMTTVTVKIVNQLTGDNEFTSPQTLVAFALGITLFTVTLALNVYALYIVRKYREQYD
ncbi:phosphate ABC transporter permease subunit PstC [Gynuella sunshinyii]|uniref:Phosphate transport system permease protein n=1 Tax=Gynuella sunshinyii YC6258 TaxID=1445510 RepID=A0A0C5VCM1_9GAMM|nr:phosphate ABC transporter permease subunit PstC [Gynuella sunshinyii]AJQ92227.1 ABC-type phosphate transport system, permease component [Gynuella sunshinyii YC6258]